MTISTDYSERLIEAVKQGACYMPEIDEEELDMSLMRSSRTYNTRQMQYLFGIYKNLKEEHNKLYKEHKTLVEKVKEHNKTCPLQIYEEEYDKEYDKALRGLDKEFPL